MVEKLAQDIHSWGTRAAVKATRRTNTGETSHSSRDEKSKVSPNEGRKLNCLRRHLLS